MSFEERARKRAPATTPMPVKKKPGAPDPIQEYAKKPAFPGAAKSFANRKPK